MGWFKEVSLEMAHRHPALSVNIKYTETLSKLGGNMMMVCVSNYNRERKQCLMMCGIYEEAAIGGREDIHLILWRLVLPFTQTGNRK